MAVMVFGWICVFLAWLWAVGAVRYHDWLPDKVGLLAAGLMVVWGAVIPFYTRRLSNWFFYLGGMVTTVWLLSFLQQPSHERNWAAGQSRLAVVQAKRLDDVTVKNCRDSEYRSESDFDVRYHDVSFKLSQLKKVWLIVQRFSNSEGLAHVFLTFEVAQPDRPSQFLAISVEVRREEGETYSPIQGLYREYELNYVYGSEEDLIGVRTVMRPDDRVFMYPLKANNFQLQKLFRNIASRTNAIGERPEFYHSLLNNCMNGILEHTYELTPEPISWMNPKVVLPGYSGQLAFEKGLSGDGKDFSDFQERCRIDVIAREHGIGPGFSQAIRSKLPVVPDS